MEEITSFIKGAICDDQCLGRCLYIHGVPGTGKVCISDDCGYFLCFLILTSYLCQTTDNECACSYEKSKI